MSTSNKNVEPLADTNNDDGDDATETATGLTISAEEAQFLKANEVAAAAATIDITDFSEIVSATNQPVFVDFSSIQIDTSDVSAFSHRQTWYLSKNSKNYDI